MQEHFDQNFDNNLEEIAFPVVQDLEKEKNSEKDEKSALISEFSIKGYQKLKANSLNEAREFFEKILELDTDNNYALVGLGDTERKQENFQEAIKFYSRCLEFHPDNNYALFGLADCYKALRQFTKAIEIWEKYLVHDEKNITVITRIADAYRKIHSYRKSAELYQQILKMEETNAYALVGLGHLNFDLKKYHEALYYWKKMI